MATALRGRGEHWRDRQERELIPLGHLSALDRKIKRDALTREREERRAYKAGLAGYGWSPANWTRSDELMYLAWEAGRVHHRRARWLQVAGRTGAAADWTWKRLVGRAWWLAPHASRRVHARWCRWRWLSDALQRSRHDQEEPL